MVDYLLDLGLISLFALYLFNEGTKIEDTEKRNRDSHKLYKPSMTCMYGFLSERSLVGVLLLGLL